MKPIRLGILGLGNMGRQHARNVLDGKVPGLRLAAVADQDHARLAPFAGVPGFRSERELINSGLIDAVLIATPHYHHTAAGIAALKAGLHVLVEKPISVHRADCVRLIAAHRRKGQVFAAMFNQRTDPSYRHLRRLVQSGALGEIRRVQWTITNWFRTAAYYSSGGWRASWAGEGGGVLLNQCPHNLDLFQWIFGLPTRVHGFCTFGRYHDIEVEDDVTAYFEMRGGAHATFITSTGEAPGSNRLEIAAERGRVVLENGVLRFTRNAVGMSDYGRKAKDGFSAPATTEITKAFAGAGEQHIGIMKNFAAAIRRGAAPIAPAAEGMHSVELANAILLSSWTGRPVELPLNSVEYARWLRRKIAASGRTPRRRKSRAGK